MPSFEQIEKIIKNGDETKGAYFDALEFLRSPEYKAAIAKKEALARRIKNFGNNISLRRYTLKQPELKFKTQEVNVYNTPLSSKRGTYYPTTGNIDLNITSPNIPGTIYHETLHNGNMGEIDALTADFADFVGVTTPDMAQAFNRWYVGKLFDPKVTNNKYFSNYILDKDAKEALVHLRTAGYKYGINPTTPYPGKEKAIEQINKIVRQEQSEVNPLGFWKENMLNMDRPDRIWRALQGLYKDGGKLLGHQWAGVGPDGYETNIDWIKNWDDYNKAKASFQLMGIEEIYID